MSWAALKNFLPEAISPYPMALGADEKSTTASLPLKKATIPSMLDRHNFIEIRMIQSIL